MIFILLLIAKKKKKKGLLKNFGNQHLTVAIDLHIIWKSMATIKGLVHPKMKILSLITLISLRKKKSILVASQNWSWATDVTWTVLPMYLLRFWTWEHFSCVAVEGQIPLRFHQKYVNLCSEDEEPSYGFGTTWGWVINDRFFILGWTNPLNVLIFQMRRDDANPGTTYKTTKFCLIATFNCNRKV